MSIKPNYWHSYIENTVINWPKFLFLPLSRCIGRRHYGEPSGLSGKSSLICDNLMTMMMMLLTTIIMMVVNVNEPLNSLRLCRWWRPYRIMVHELSNIRLLLNSIDSILAVTMLIQLVNCAMTLSICLTWNTGQHKTWWSLLIINEPQVKHTCLMTQSLSIACLNPWYMPCCQCEIWQWQWLVWWLSVCSNCSKLLAQLRWKHGHQLTCISLVVLALLSALTSLSCHYDVMKLLSLFMT